MPRPWCKPVKLNNQVLHRSLSEQTWGICRKIAEIDTFLVGERVTDAEIRAIHPEVCFWALAGRSPMQYNKKSREGLDERANLLRSFEPETDRLLSRVLNRELRRNVSEDDVLDALVAFVTSRAPKSKLKSLRGLPASDEKGLPMEMVYVEK
jgi:predicted RNase H-like nuclease